MMMGIYLKFGGNIYSIVVAREKIIYHVNIGTLNINIRQYGFGVDVFVQHAVTLSTKVIPVKV